MRLHRILPVILALLGTAPVIARTDFSDPVVITVGGKDVNLSEFEYLYRKNVGQQMEPITLDEYVDMFVVYKLKVADAEAAGLDTTTSFIKEFHGYRADITAPYLTDRAMLDSLRQEAMSHYAANVDVRHIMFAPTAAKDYIDSVYHSLLHGADFAATAARVSVDRMSAPHGGRLGFIAAGRYPYSFENAAYTTPVGTISAPVATHAGIHIIRVNDRRKDIGQIKVRHILKLTRGLDEDGVRTKRESIDSIAALLAAGADFATLASAETDDPSGRSSGGELPWFGSGMMVPEFEQAAFALSPGSLSGIIESQYGFHIILCENKRSTIPDDDIAAAVATAMEADGRSKMARDRFFARFRAGHPELAGADTSAITDAAITYLAASNPDLRHLLSEYRDGILLYEISNREIWSRPTTDPAGLEAYFKAHRPEYSFDTPRYKGYVIQATSDSLAHIAADYLKSVIDSLPADRLSTALRSRFGTDVRVDRVLAAKGDNAIMDHIIWNSEPPVATGRFSAYLPFGGHIITEPEEAADAGAALATDWQKALEDSWIARLRSTYPVKINRRILRRLK